MDETKPLTGHDYMNLPFNDLIQHPDFSQDAVLAALIVSGMKTEELEELYKHLEGDK